MPTSLAVMMISAILASLIAGCAKLNLTAGQAPPPAFLGQVHSGGMGGSGGGY